MFAPFRDRRDAGRRLAARLGELAAAGPEAWARPVVFALPRGGVVVGYEVARALGAPLDVLVVRKLGAPGQPELGVGALVDGDSPEAILNPEVVRLAGVTREYLDAEVARQLEEIHRREARYRQGRPRLPVAGRTAVVVDDGIATGGSVRAALRGLGRARPVRLVLAVPVAPRDTVEALRAEVDEVVCLETPEPFLAVGYHYGDFAQTTDEEVVTLLERARDEGHAAPA
jgi:putative phosphoribosyl transferase